MSAARFDNSTPGSSPIQFGTAEYLGSPGADHCQFCQQPSSGTYYRVHGAMACRGCAEKAQSELTHSSHADYIRGLLYGAGAAIAGLILYAAFEIATSLIIGYVSLAVGWMVGKAMMKGSNGQGGRRYQITAALLTYAAVSMAAIPVWIHYSGAHKQAQHASLTLAVLGLASPFLELSDPLHGAIGLFILFIGIRIAWQITGQKLPAIEGPFPSSPRPPAGVSAG
jgi:hypothetical protein